MRNKIILTIIWLFCLTSCEQEISKDNFEDENINNVDNDKILADQFEIGGDNSIDTAIEHNYKYLLESYSTKHSIHNSQDIDWIKIKPLDKGDIIKVGIKTVNNSTPALTMELYDTDKKTVLYKSNNKNGNNLIFTVINTEGFYYIKITSIDNYTGYYYFEIERTSNFGGVEDEPNNSFDNAVQIDIETSQEVHSSFYAGSINDSDYYKFSLHNTGTYVFRISGGDSNFILNADVDNIFFNLHKGNSVIMNSDLTPVFKDKKNNYYITGCNMNLVIDQYYYLSIGDSSSAISNIPYSYRLKAGLVEIDDFDRASSNDKIEYPSEIEIGNTYTLSTYKDNQNIDIDYLSFSPSKPGYYLINISKPKNKYNLSHIILNLYKETDGKHELIKSITDAVPIHYYTSNLLAGSNYVIEIKSGITSNYYSTLGYYDLKISDWNR